jgi:hypothetical protein
MCRVTCRAVYRDWLEELESEQWDVEDLSCHNQGWRGDGTAGPAAGAARAAQHRRRVGMRLPGAAIDDMNSRQWLREGMCDIEAGSMNRALRCTKPLIWRDGEPREADGVHKTGRLRGYFHLNMRGTLVWPQRKPARVRLVAKFGSADPTWTAPAGHKLPINFERSKPQRMKSHEQWKL